MKAIGLLLLCAASVSAVENPADFAWRAPIKTEASAPYYRVTLPVAAYLNTTQAGLAELRVFNAAGVPVPYARTHAAGSKEHNIQRTAVHWFPLQSASGTDTGSSALNVRIKQSGDGTLVEVNTHGAHPVAGKAPVRGYVLDASTIKHRDKVQALELDWSDSADGFHLLDVEVSDNLQDWRSVQSNVQLARLSFSGERIAHRRIELPGLSGRYIRLHWRDPALAPQLTRAEIEQDSAEWRSPPLVWSPVLTAQASPSIKLQEGEYFYQLAQAIPASRLRISLPQGNVLLPIDILQVGKERRNSYSITRGVAYRISSNGREWMQDEIALPGNHLKAFILRLDPRSSHNVAAPSVQIGIQPEQVVFLAEGTAPYQLASGKAKLPDAALPLTMLVPGFGTPNAPQIAEATLDRATPVANQASSDLATSAQTNTDWKKLALLGLLFAGVTAMGAMAWQLVRQMKRNP